MQEDLLARLKSQFESRGVKMPATNIKQATLIPSAKVIPNPMGDRAGMVGGEERSRHRGYARSAERNQLYVGQ